MGDAYSYTNNSFFAAAHPALAATGNPEWDLRFTEWLTADGLARADLEFGRYADASYEYDNVKSGLTCDYGKQFQKHPDGKAAWEPVWTAMLAAEETRSETYLKPMWEASRALMLTPTPNLAAALFKIELAKREELNNDGEMAKLGDPFELVASDMACLLRELS